MKEKTPAREDNANEMRVAKVIFIITLYCTFLKFNISHVKASVQHLTGALHVLVDSWKKDMVSKKNGIIQWGANLL